jgi:hypothetical protein
LGEPLHGRHDYLPARHTTDHESACEWPTTSGARCLHIAMHQRCLARERHPTTAILPSCRRTCWVRTPRQRIRHTALRKCHTLSETNFYHPTHIMKAQVRLAAPAERRGGFGTFGWTMWAAGMTRNSHRLAVNLTTTTRASNSKSSPAAFSARRLTRKPPGTTRQLDLSYVLARRNRLRPRATDLSPRAGSRQPRLTDCSAAAAPPPRPSAGETPSRADPLATQRPGRRARVDASSLGPARST